MLLSWLAKFGAQEEPEIGRKQAGSNSSAARIPVYYST